MVDLAPLADLLQSDALALLHAADQDLEVFRRSCGATPTRMFDTQIVANFAGFSTPSLATLAERLVGVKLPKGDRMTDWTRRPLTEGQRTYAASDVEHLAPIRERLIADLEKSGRLAWAEAECEASLARAATPRASPIPRGGASRRRASAAARPGRSRRNSRRGGNAGRRRPTCRVRFVLPDLADRRNRPGGTDNGRATQRRSWPERQGSAG